MAWGDLNLNEQRKISVRQGGRFEKGENILQPMNEPSGKTPRRKGEQKATHPGKKQSGTKNRTGYKKTKVKKSVRRGGTELGQNAGGGGEKKKSYADKRGGKGKKITRKKKKKLQG